MPEAFLASVQSRRGHFTTESGYHTDHWMDLETLCRKPAAIQPFARELASRLKDDRLDAVCGPLNEGAFVALMVAAELGCDFTYAERFVDTTASTLFPVRYVIPKALRPIVAGRRVAIVNDVISAGSAVRGAAADLEAAGATVVAIACLLVMGDAIERFAEERHLRLETVARAPYALWPPDECPLCGAGVPIESVS